MSLIIFFDTDMNFFRGKITEKTEREIKIQLIINFINSEHF